MAPARELEPGRVRAVLCDADGCLFPSEEPAFAASAEVTNRALESFGCRRRYSARELRIATTGKSFRTTIAELAAAEQAVPEQLERWVAEERERVTAHLREQLEPDPEVSHPLASLARSHLLAAVSSSALSRLQACFEATGLDGLICAEQRFSAEDSLARPASKPDPAVYLHAVDRLELGSGEAVAIEDSLPGAQSAIAAGIPTLGNVCFVRQSERPARIEELRRVGVVATVSSWAEVERLLCPLPDAQRGPVADLIC